MCSTDIFLGILAVLFPPLPVWVKCGLCSAESIINILLCVLGFIPGLLHSWYIIAKYPDPPYEYESISHHDRERGGGRVTYVYVQSPHGPHCQSPQPQNGMNYGTQRASPQPRPQELPTQPQEDGIIDHGEGGSGQAPPPSYAQVVAGDHKIQTHD
ncbi:Plasma membrane proteolipid 3 [Cladobotryum mycophilum]|uniref:Plasma membrane proteolipid 3 n=1 Tax=Cladobotryum mycophilum TaxID=491253 RepID=A0ABR0SHU1_9HYPO